MASEVLGLFNTPSTQELRNRYLDSMMVSPAQMGSQGLLQQVVSMGRNAGAMLGMGAGQLLGGKVAGEVEANYIDEAIKAAAQTGGSQIEKMQTVADFLADKPGMGRQYMMAVQEVNKLKAQELQTQKMQQELQPEYKDIWIPIKTTKINALGNPVEVEDSIRVTYKWNPKTKQYEPMSPTKAAEESKASTGKPGKTDAEKAAEALARREAIEAKAARTAIDPNMPSLNVAP